MIYSRKRYSATNITIHKITESLESNTILEGNYDEGEIHLILNLKYIVIFLEPVSPIIKSPNSMRLFLCETNVRDYQCKTEAATYHYL